MTEMMLKMPLACFLLVSYSFYFYKKTKRLETYSTQAFEALLYCTLLHLVAETVTEYTVNHRDQVPEMFNYIWHVIFLLSVLAFCFIMYYYLLTYVERGGGIRKKKEQRIVLAVWIAVSAAILVLPIEYVDTRFGSYSLGPKAYALYVGVVFVLVMILYNLLTNWSRIEKIRREVMLTSTGIFVLFSIQQMIFPYVLTTGLGLSMMVMGLLMTTEDAHLYVDGKTGLFNEQGCREMLKDMIFHGKSFQIPVYVYVGNLSRVTSCFNEAAAYMTEHYHSKGAVLAENMIAFLPEQRLSGKSVQYPERLPLFAENNHLVKEFSILLSGDGNSSEEEILKKMKQFKEHHEEMVLYRDAMSGVLNRNAYERDAAQQVLEARSVWYLLIDINHLKWANDTYGHAAGDELICRMAVLLKDTLKDNGKVYRVGGDEFAVFYTGKQVEKMVEQLEFGRRKCNEGNTVPLSYAIGYAYYAPGRSEWEEVTRHADFNMYKDKLQQNNKTPSAIAQQEQ